MLKRLHSTLRGFKEIRLHAGLNVLLSEKSPGASARQTRNSAGKTSFCELLHFLLGGKVGRDHFLRTSALESSAFALEFDLRDAAVEAERTAATPAEVVVRSTRTSDWPYQPKVDRTTGRSVLSNERWRAVLGDRWFGLTSEDSEAESRFQPTFRSLISYFIRRQGAGGFLAPTTQSKKQMPWDSQVAISFLLGLDTSPASELQGVRERETALTLLKRAARGGALGDVLPSASALRTQVTLAESRVRQVAERLRNFRVLPEYAEYEAEASRLTAALSHLANANTTDRETAASLRESLVSETPPRFDEVERLYQQAGVALPATVAKRFDDVERFHRSVVENRRSHLQAEISAAERRIEERERQKAQLDSRRGELMGILRSGGALDQYAKIQGELGRLEAGAESLRRRYEAAEALLRKSATLDVERATLVERLRNDHHERRAAVDAAILAFEDLSSSLYERAGELTVDATPNGPEFNIRIAGSRSRGISNMQIFCFDMMLMELCQAREIGPGFLVHDSHLFDGVDERQTAKALEIGAERAARKGFQYIVTMNEDAVPSREFTPGFSLEPYILPVRLTDATEDGGLFGLRFE